jgi:hypothetical protein
MPASFAEISSIFFALVQAFNAALRQRVPRTRSQTALNARMWLLVEGAARGRPAICSASSSDEAKPDGTGGSHSIDCEGSLSTAYPEKFMETNCPSSFVDKGVEIDWLRVSWDVLTDQSYWAWVDVMDWG